MDECPACHGTDVRLDGKVEPPIALLGEDEYVERCGECGAEWVRNVTRDRVDILRD